MVQEASVDYDKENDDLFVYRKNGKVKGSIDIGDFIVDLSHEGKVIGIEIMNASANIASLTNFKITKNALSNIKKARLAVRYKPDAMYIYTSFFLANKELGAMIPIPAVA